MIRVRPAAASERIAALELLWCETEDPQNRAEEILASAARGEVSLKELIVAESAGMLLGAGLFTEQPGRVGFVFPPGAPPAEPGRAEIQHAILAAICQRLDELNLSIGQVILDPENLEMRAVLDQSGFPHLTDLHYMVRPGDAASITDWPSERNSETYRPANLKRFAQVLGRTYIGTLDCPELEGLRSPEEALAAHQATGQFDPNRWWLFRHEGVDAGVLLMNEHPERELLEIVYLGVVPQARGKGLGQILVERALAEAGRLQHSLVLAVDARNHPARRLYQQAGFLDVTVQSVHLRQARQNALNP